jgi:hypothetical protein
MEYSETTPEQIKALHATSVKELTDNGTKLNSGCPVHALFKAVLKDAFPGKAHACYDAGDVGSFSGDDVDDVQCTTFRAFAEEWYNLDSMYVYWESAATGDVHWVYLIHQGPKAHLEDISDYGTSIEKHPELRPVLDAIEGKGCHPVWSA